MPEISRFLGILIAMYYRDHEPAHFHAFYGEHQITVEVASGRVRGVFPRRARSLVLEWWDLHRDELAANWARAKERQPLEPIDGLE
jgi:hypothetical protein